MIIAKQKHFLFFFVHPSKYYLFRNTVNTLKAQGHIVDIIIVTKDILEDLIKKEGWEYTNIFPEGRRSKSKKAFSIIWKTGINFFRTVYRLYKYCYGKKFDLFITDDCLTVIGWLKRVKCIMYIDDDINAVPENKLLYLFAYKIISPTNTNLGKFNSKKIPVKSYKELASLHPDYFTPDINIVKSFNPELDPYVIIRLVALTASHDRNKKGINDKQLLQLIDLLKAKYKIFISSEKALMPDFEEYQLRVRPEEIAHVLYYSEMYIGDSQTMSSEAALLGIPAIRCNDFVGKITVMDEKEYLYGILRNFKPSEFDRLYETVKIFINTEGLKQDWKVKRDKMLKEMEDINIFLIKLFTSETL
jgi:uncharacterized protein